MSPRSLFVIAHDLAAAVAAWTLAYLLRFNFEVPPQFEETLTWTLPWVVLTKGVVFHAFGLYRGVWRFASLPDLRRIFLAVGVAALAAPVLLFLVQRLEAVPRSVLILDPVLLVLIMGGSRFAYRSWRDGDFFSWRGVPGAPVLVLGAGQAASQLLRELATRAEWRVVAILDEDPGMHRRSLHGVPVRGGFDVLPRVVRETAAKHVIIALPDAERSLRRRAVESAQALGMHVLTVPSVDDLLSGRAQVSQLRPVQLEDLLGRERVQLDDRGLQRLLAQRVVLVTGAGGSIGAELCRQVARFGPSRLVCLEVSELALYSLEQEFCTRLPDLPVSYLIADVRDAARLEAVFAEYRPAVVFHAAAYKHVPLMEDANAAEAVRNNVLGTLRVGQAAMRHGVEKFVMISTDKAVNPTNVMGATKRLAERVVQLLQRQEACPTRFVTVRFGNVLGSNGSVIPKFREQIARGGPVTVTHPEIIRYFMLIPEAVQLVLQAGLMGGGGEIFVLDMGEPVKIVDLARDMIRLSGFSEDEVRIEYTGLRPGEKLYEELLADDEQTTATPHPKVRVALAREEADREWLVDLQAWLESEHLVRGSADVKTRLRGFVPEYRPQ